MSFCVIVHAVLAPHHFDLIDPLTRQNPMDIQTSLSQEGQEIGTGLGVGVFLVRQIGLANAEALCIRNNPDLFLVGTD